MKKKLLIAGLLGMAMCVLYACVRDGSPAPEPSGPSLEKARGFFENQIAELKLPNPRFNLPGGNPVTKSGVPFALLLGDGITPLWEYSRGYTCGELNIVEIPVSRSNHIRYSIYITEDGTEIRDLSDPDTRLIVIEDPEHESMSAFLVTLLPSSDYDQGTRNLPYVLIDTDFSGISIYSDPGGAPTFGRYFVEGQEEYVFRFPENEEESVQEGFLRIGILYSEGATRGIAYDLEIDDVVVTGRKPFTPPEYEGFDFCTVCHQTTCICSPLKFQFHDIEGKGFGSTPISEPEPRPKEAEKDCSGNANEIRDKAGSQLNKAKNAIATTIGTKEYISYNEYMGSVTADNSIEHSTSIIDYGTGSMLLTPTIHGTATNVNIDYSSSSTIGSIHSHPNGTPPSAVDLMTTGHIAGQRSGYQYTMIYANGTYYTIYVDNASKAAAFYNSYNSQVDPSTNWWKAGSEISNHLDENKDFREFEAVEQQIYQLADILASFDSGMRLVEIASGGQTTSYGVNHKTGNKYKTPTKCTE